MKNKILISLAVFILVFLWITNRSFAMSVMIFLYTGIYYIWLYLLAGIIIAKVVNYLYKVQKKDLSLLKQGLINIVSGLVGMGIVTFIFKYNLVDIFPVTNDKDVLFIGIAAFLFPLILFWALKKISFLDFQKPLYFQIYITFICFMIFINVYSATFNKLGYCNMVVGETSQSECWHSLAIENQDIELCNKTDNIHCLTEIAVSTQDPTVCEKVPVNNRKQEHCYRLIAIELSDEYLCDKIQSDLSMDCLRGVAEKKQDPLICERLLKEYPNHNSGEICYYDIALEKADISLCEKIIKDKEQHDLCIKVISNIE